MDFVLRDAYMSGYNTKAFDLWRLTHDDFYKRTAYQYFTGMRDNLRVAGGYTIAGDVTTSPMTLGDYTPAYWFAENQKYLYLTFAGGGAWSLDAAKRGKS